MKRKDLYNYIREEIIGTLSEESVAWSSNTKSQAKQHIDKSKLSSDAKKQAKDEIDQTPSGLISNVSESDLDEMANIASIIKIQDADKFALAKEIYTGGRTAAILSALEEVGDEGITPQALADKIGAKASNEINLILNNLRAAGIISGKRDKLVKPEKPSKEEPSEEPDTDMEPADTWEKPEEEEPETTEKEPEVDKDIEKAVGDTYSDLSPEEEDVYTKFRQAIINKAKVIRDEKSSKEDKAKARAAIDNYKTKADLKKLFLKKGLSLIDFISDELKK